MKRHEAYLILCQLRDSRVFRWLAVKRVRDALAVAIDDIALEKDTPPDLDEAGERAIRVNEILRSLDGMTYSDGMCLLQTAMIRVAHNVNDIDTPKDRASWLIAVDRAMRILMKDFEEYLAMTAPRQPDERVH